MAGFESLERAVADAESGNRDFDAAGNVVTSPKGARGRMQVMDATNADPGFGVQPAQNDSLEERARVGRDYLRAMVDRYDGDVRKGLAAYNAGPGRLDDAIARGGDGWLDLMPQETIDYTNKIVGQMTPQAGALDRAAEALLPAAQAAEAAGQAKPKALPWKQVIAKQEFLALSPEEQAAAQQQYFDEVVAPHVPKHDLEAARSEFYSAYPPGRGVQAAAPDTSEERGPDGVLRVNMAQQDPATASAVPDDDTGGGLLDGIGSPSEWGRQLGLTARAAVSGVAGLPQAAFNGVTSGINAAFGTDIPPADIGDTLDAIGLPKPQNSVERVAQDVAGALSGTGGSVALGRAMGNAAAPLAQRVGNVLAAAPKAQAASAAAGSAAGGITREEGGSGGQQLAAALIAGLGPAALTATGKGLARSLFRGGEEGRKRVNDAFAAFARAGTTPTVGQATQGRGARAAESALAKLPGSAGVINRKAAAQAEEIAAQVDKVADRLATKTGPVEAGEAIEQALERFKAGAKTLTNHLYNKLDQHLPASTPITVDRTRHALAALNTDIQGAPALSAMFKNGKIQGIESALGADLKTGSTAYGAQAARKSSTLPYESVKKLRTLVGQEVDNNSFTSDVPRSKWRALYGALSEDLGDAAVRAGPEAERAWKWANQFTRMQAQRLEELAKVVDRGAPERIFGAALQGTADGDTIVRRVVNAMPKETRRELASAVLRRMGRSLPGQQNDAGDAFSTERFLTNWSRMSPEARHTIFGRAGDSELLDELASVAQVASNLRDGSRVFANPSGTAGAIANASALAGAASALGTGNYGMAAGVLGTAGGANLAARVLSSPAFVRMLGEKTQLRPGVAAGALNGLVAGGSARMSEEPSDN
ncbi:lytic transglycosylase domain-containing protein [Achromobacter xylosoxidans]